MFWWINQRILWIALALLICALPFTSFLRDYAQLESLVSAWIFLLLTFMMLFGPVNNAFLQAQQNFRWLAIAGVASHGLKLLFCVSLIFAGFKLNGVLMGMVFTTITVWFITYIPLRAEVAQYTGVEPSINHLSFKGTIPVLIANFSFAVLTQIDLLLVNHYFNAYQAGIYASAAILGKAVMYLPGAITIAMFPMVAENESRSQSSANLFLNAMMLTAGLSSAGAVFYFLFADDIMTLFYGQKYQGAAELLKLYGFAMLPMTLVMVAEHFLIAKGRVVFAYAMMIGIPFVLFAAHKYHASLIDMVYILAAGGLGVALVGFGVIGVQVWAAKSPAQAK